VLVPEGGLRVFRKAPEGHPPAGPLRGRDAPVAGQVRAPTGEVDEVAHLTQDEPRVRRLLSPCAPTRLLLRGELGLDPLPQLSRAAPVQRPQRLAQRGLIEPRGPLVELVAGQPVLSHKRGAYLGAALAEVHAPLPGPVPAGVACGVGE